MTESTTLTEKQTDVSESEVSPLSICLPLRQTQIHQPHTVYIYIHLDFVLNAQHKYKHQQLANTEIPTLIFCVLNLNL